MPSTAAAPGALTASPDPAPHRDVPRARRRQPWARRADGLVTWGIVGTAAFALLLAVAELVEVPGASYSLMLGTWGPHWLTLLVVLAVLAVVAFRRRPGRARACAVAALAVATAITGGVGWAQLSYVARQGIVIDAWALTGIGQGGAAPDEEPVVLDDTETGQQLRAGVWYPRDASGRRLAASRTVPVVVLIHGGGWSNGNRLNPMTRGQADWLAHQGYLAIAVDYPLSTPELATWELAESRTACALAWVGANAGAYGGDTGRLALVGDSAGGHLALELTYRQALGEMPQPPEGCSAAVPQIDAVSTTYPVADPVGFHDNPDLVMGPFTADRAQRYTGGTPRQVPGRYAAIDPVTRLERISRAGAAAGLPPTLIVAGQQDHVVPVAGARALDAALSRAGAPHETLIVPYTDHVFDLNPGSAVSQLWRGRTLALFAGAGLAAG